MVKLSAALALADIGDHSAEDSLKQAIDAEKDTEVHSQMTEALKRLASSRKE